jgi:hypothetical protein
MKEIFQLYLKIRERQLKLLNSFSPEELAIIPKGFKNNILWNLSHCVVTQQLYCYANSQLPTYLSDDFIAQYRKGTVPDGHIPTTEEIETLKKLLLGTVRQLETDYYQGIFKSYTPYITGIEYPLNNIEEALYFNISHEGVHLGSVLALKCAIEQ